MYKIKSLRQSISFLGVLSLAILFVFTSASCEKYTTPNKTKKKLENGSWKVTTCTYQGVNVTPEFVTEAFTFSEGEIKVKSDPTITGGYSTGLNKNPAVLYISGFVTTPHDKLNGDWNVLTCSSNTVTLESINGSLASNVTLSKL